MFRNALPTALLATLTASLAAGQTVVSGPTLNPGNGHRYTLLQAASWLEARQWARTHGFDLATIEDPAENAWVFSAFSAMGTRKFFLGMSDADHPGTLAWSDGSASTWGAWAAGEPSAAAAPGQRCVIVQSDQRWYVRPSGYSPYYLMEASGPLKVPQEFTDLRAAFLAMDNLDVYDLDLSGRYGTTHTLAQNVPAGRRGTIRGVTPDAQITLTGDSGGFNLTGAWTFDHLTIERYAATTAIHASGAELRLLNVVLDGYMPSRGELIHLSSGATLEARSCILSNAWLGIWSDAAAPAPVSLDNCLTEMVGRVTGAGVNAVLSNCTLVDLGAWNAGVFGPGTTRLVNSIVWDLHGTLADGPAEVSHCNIDGGYPGPGNLNVDPLFAGFENYRLAPGSPCINAGSPAEMRGAGLDLDGAPRIAGAAPDLGAYELPESPCLVDFNRDGFVDFFDYDDFVAAFESGC